MDKFERVKRAKMGVYDDYWLYGDDAVEMVRLLGDNGTEEKCEKFIDEWNSLGCTSLIFTSEEIKSLLNKRDDD